MRVDYRKGLLACDTETTVDESHAQVWLCGFYEPYTDEFEWFRSLPPFMDRLSARKEDVAYFHNLKFDGMFLICYLEGAGFRYVERREFLTYGTYTALITDDGQFYSLEIFFPNGKRLQVRDSLKVIKCPVREMPKAFGLAGMEKGSLDYGSYVSPPERISADEMSYFYNDCAILGKALRILWDTGNRHMTSAANAMANYRKTVGAKKFRRLFPTLTAEQDAFIRRAYKGGYVYCEESHAGKDCGRGFTVDVNSLYPSRCRGVEDTPLPYGEPLYFKGEPDPARGLFVVRLYASFTLREGMLPTVQLKNNPRFAPTQYLKDSVVDGVPCRVELFLTSVDLALFLEHYDVSGLEYAEGYYFKSSKGLWAEYVDENMRVKEQATRDGNAGLRTIAKYNMNEPTGKFATRADGGLKRPGLSPDGAPAFTGYEGDARKLIYCPMSVFITAWGRDKMVRTAQRLHDQGIFRYCDTDSAHCEGRMPLWLWKECDHTALGKWDVEQTWRRARFLRAKTYIEEVKRKRPDGVTEYVPHIRCAGLSGAQKGQVTFSNFHMGAVYHGKLVQKAVPGGCVLAETDFEIH